MGSGTSPNYAEPSELRIDYKLLWAPPDLVQRHASDCCSLHFPQLDLHYAVHCHAAMPPTVAYTMCAQCEQLMMHEGQVHT